MVYIYIMNSDGLTSQGGRFPTERLGHRASALACGRAICYTIRMTTTIKRGHAQPRSPKPGMTIEPVITYEELPIVTEQARRELLDSLEKGEADGTRGRVERLSAGELKSEMRKTFEKVTGFKIP
jgi:hypothetical protein